MLGNWPKPVAAIITSYSAKTGTRVGESEDKSSARRVNEGYVLRRWVYEEGVRTARVMK